ncbi:MAG: hypothetical protein ACRDDF_07420 [Aeromonas sp.]
MVELFTSEDEQIALGQLLSESLYPAGIIIDGEVMVKGMTFQKSSGRIRSKKPIPVGELEFVVYGYLPLEHFTNPENDKRTVLDVATCVMQEQIKVLLCQLNELLPQMSWSQVQSYDVFDIESLHELYELVRDAGHEGLVVKDPLAPWHRGKRNGWWKMKPEDTIDGQVVGIVWGTVGKKYEGKVVGFEVRLEDNGCVVRADGLTDTQIEEYTKMWWADRHETTAEHDNGVFHHWYIQLKFMERTEDGSLRHPKFDCWRGTETDPTVKS